MRKRMRTVSFLLLSLAFSLGGRIYASEVGAGMAIVQQTSKVTGTVIDNFGPVAGASVVVKGTTNGVMTDMDGKFVLSNVKKAMSSRSLISVTSPRKSLIRGRLLWRYR